MLYGGDGGKGFRERHRFVWWMKVLNSDLLLRLVIISTK